MWHENSPFIEVWHDNSPLWVEKAQRKWGFLICIFKWFQILMSSGVRWGCRMRNRGCFHILEVQVERNGMLEGRKRIEMIGETKKIYIWKSLCKWLQTILIWKLCGSIYTSDGVCKFIDEKWNEDHKDRARQSIHLSIVTKHTAD